MAFFQLFVAVVAIYFVLSPRFAPCLYRPILFPRLKMTGSQNPPVIQGIGGRSLTIYKKNGHHICAWFYQNLNAELTLLVSHGNYGNMRTHSYLTEALISAGHSVFIYDYSGYGASSGLPDLRNITNDGEYAYDYLINNEKISPEKVVLYGESIGASVASYLASVREAKGLICQSGFSALRTIATQKLPLLFIYPSCLFPKHNLDTAENLNKIKIPVLIMHGVKDKVVPFEHARIIFEAAANSKTIVSFPECDHGNITILGRNKFIDETKNFFSHLCQTKSIG